MTPIEKFYLIMTIIPIVILLTIFIVNRVKKQTGSGGNRRM